MEKIKTFIESLDMPYWGTIDKIKYEDEVLTITYCYYYRIVINKKYPREDGVIADRDCRWAKEDLEFAVNVFEERDIILEMVENL